MNAKYCIKNIAWTIWSKEIFFQIFIFFALSGRNTIACQIEGFFSEQNLFQKIA